MIKYLPFLPIPANIAKNLASIFRRQAFALSRFMPGLKMELAQADIDINARDYISIAIFSGILAAVVSFVSILILSLAIAPIKTAFAASLLIAVVIYFAIFTYVIFYPRLVIQKKVKLLERDLLFALKYILIRIKSGGSLYDAMVGVAQGDYGEVSIEFRKVVKEIATGTEDVVALENMALRAPSTFFRRTIWQITNNLRAGSDTSKILETITSTLVREQKILIRKYGSELNPIILMYMMFAIIIPSLGITVMIVMSSLSGLVVPVYVFYLIPVLVLIAQIFFTRIIKDKKPMLSFAGG